MIQIEKNGVTSRQRKYPSVQFHRKRVQDSTQVRTHKYRHRVYFSMVYFANCIVEVKFLIFSLPSDGLEVALMKAD